MNVPKNPGGVNLNTIISVGGFAIMVAGFGVTIGGGWAAMKQSETRSEMRHADSERRIDALELADRVATDAIRAIQIAGATTNAESTALRREIGELKENLRDMQAELREVANLLRAAKGDAR